MGKYTLALVAVKEGVNIDVLLYFLSDIMKILTDIMNWTNFFLRISASVNPPHSRPMMEYTDFSSSP